MFLVLTDVTDRHPLSPSRSLPMLTPPVSSLSPHSSGRGEVSWFGLVGRFGLKLVIQALSMDGQSLQAPEGEEGEQTWQGKAFTLIFLAGYWGALCGVGPHVLDTFLQIPARVYVSSVSALNYPFGSAWTDTSVPETSATDIPFKIQSPGAVCPVSHLQEPPGQVRAGALGSPGEVGLAVTRGGLTFCRNFQRMGTVSLPFTCSTRCRRCPTVTLLLQLHILEL